MRRGFKATSHNYLSAVELLRRDKPRTSYATSDVQVSYGDTNSNIGSVELDQRKTLSD